jgi:hypothetical protein
MKCENPLWKCDNDHAIILIHPKTKVHIYACKDCRELMEEKFTRKKLLYTGEVIKLKPQIQLTFDDFKKSEHA